MSSCPCQNNCTIFLGYTSNLISSGVRESIRFLAEHKMVEWLEKKTHVLVQLTDAFNYVPFLRVVFSPPIKVDVLVTTAGGIEEDLIKCMGSFYLGDFTLSGKDLYKKGLNRSENMIG